MRNNICLQKNSFQKKVSRMSRKRSDGRKKAASISKSKKIRIDQRPHSYNQYSWSPVPDNVKEFVGREVELMGFWNEMANLVGVGQTRKSNYAFIGQRKLGKTAYLKRCYNIAFWEQDEVVPFYYSFAQNDGDSDYIQQLSNLQKNMPIIFLKQFLSYCTKDETFLELILVEDIFDYLEKTKFPRYEKLIKSISGCLQNIREATDIYILECIWALTQELSFFVRKKCFLIIDEAQEMDISIFDGKRQRKCKASIADIIQKDHSLVFVSGSNVSMLVNNFLDYSFANRFEKFDFTPLIEEDAKELIKRKAPKSYRGLAKDLINLVGGNPDYINKILTFNIKYTALYREQKSFSSEIGLQQAYDFEVLNPKGKIYYFWQVHLQKNKADLNRDPKGKKGLALQLLYKVSKNPGREFSYSELMKEFCINEDTLVRKIDQLESANLIEPTGIGRFAHAFPDKILPVVINKSYHQLIIEGPSKKVAQEAKEDYKILTKKLKTVIEQAELELDQVAKDVSNIQSKISTIQTKRIQLDSHIKAALGKLSLRKGFSKENTIRKKIRRMIEKRENMFSQLHLDGEVSSVNICNSNGTGCEIDIFAKLKKKRKRSKPVYLISEVKNTKSKVSYKQAQKFVASVKRAVDEYDIEDAIIVYISRNGFAAKAEKYLTSLGIKCGASEKVFL